MFHIVKLPVLTDAGSRVLVQPEWSVCASSSCLQALQGQVYEGYVGPFQETQSGKFIGMIDSKEVLAGEFSDPTRPDSATVLVTRHHPNRPLASARVIMRSWYEQVCRIDLNSGKRVPVSGPSNSATVALDALPAQVLRFFKKETPEPPRLEKFWRHLFVLRRCP